MVTYHMGFNRLKEYTVCAIMFLTWVTPLIQKAADLSLKPLEECNIAF